MSTDQTLAFLLFAVVAAVTPGPSNVLLAAVGANVGVRRGLPCLFGVAMGMGFLVSAVALGLGSLVLDRPAIIGGLKWGGSGFLLWLAWKIATAGRGEAATGTDVVGFWRAAALQWVNPKAWLVSAGAAGAYLQADGASAAVQATLFGLLFVLAALPSCLVWLALGASCQGLLRTPRAWRGFNLAMGALLAASIVFFVW